jgi:hypothetical protein
MGTRTHTCTCACRCTCVCGCMCTWSYTCTGAITCPCTCVCICPCLHVCMYEYACACADAPRSATQACADGKFADPNRGSAVLWEGGHAALAPRGTVRTRSVSPWVGWRRLTTAAIANIVAPGLTHKTSIPQNTIAECAWCGATERAGPQPKLLNQWNDHRATATIYRHGRQ